MAESRIEYLAKRLEDLRKIRTDKESELVSKQVELRLLVEDLKSKYGLETLEDVESKITQLRNELNTKTQELESQIETLETYVKQFS